MESAAASAPSSLQRVLLVEDHAIMRRVVRTLIERIPGYAVCAEAGDAEQAQLLAQRERPDLAVVDISLGATDGLALTKALREREPTLPILILSMHNEGMFVDSAFRAGASGYLMKSEAPERLAEALAAVGAGKKYSRESVSKR